MLLKINNKPVQVVEETEEETTFSPVYLGVSLIGYSLILWIMDYVCFVFFSVHPFPFFTWIGGLLAWLGIL